jgi:hypothetical protein
MRIVKGYSLLNGKRVRKIVFPTAVFQYRSVVSLTCTLVAMAAIKTSCGKLVKL